MLQGIIEEYNARRAQGQNAQSGQVQQPAVDTRGAVLPPVETIAPNMAPVESQLPVVPAVPVAPAEPVVPVASAPTNRWGYTESEMEALAKSGYTPERLESLVSGTYTPASGGFLERIYRDTTRTPVAPDERRIRQANTVSGIADALGLISQMVGARAGAHVRERDYAGSALGRTQAREQELRNTYLKQQADYDTGLYNARLKEFIRGLDDYNKGRAGIQTVLTNKRRLDQAQERIAADRARADATAADRDRNFALRERDTENRIAARNASTAQGWVRANRVGTGSGSRYDIVFPAVPNDPNATPDSFGNNVRTLSLTPGQVDRYAREALADSVFMANNQDLVLKQPNYRGEGARYAPKKDIAAAYVRRLYESQFTEDDQINMPWLRDIVDRHEDWGYWEEEEE